MKSCWSRRACLLASAMLAGCSALPVAQGPGEIASSPWAAESTAASATVRPQDADWRHHTFPGKAPTKFSYTRMDGRNAVEVQAASSASMLRKRVRLESAELGSVRFSWKVPQLIAEADMASRERDDSPVRVVLVFEGDRSRFSARDAMLSELVHAVTGEQLPYATLMYVWSNQREPGTVISSPRTDRIRTLVMESGPAKLDRWLDYERDIATDFRRAFGEAPGALVGVGIMTDCDNTRSQVKAWYGPLRLRSGRTTRVASD